MLQIKNISKKYVTGGLLQNALDDVSLTLRDNEFVAILGPSGSGKTTLLNVIGGLDRYDSGDLIINGISTKKYKDRDWDSYRNHTIGFVFQSYNLIPHQNILANVELALTISGISKSERKKRAKQALEKVGLGDQLHKKPNQMSGGQMQRVAIARALVNDPDILLADEPTGALDTETSIQVMELLKEVAGDRLVVMVTHNPELAEEYATRIVKLRDGQIKDDSQPFTEEEKEEAEHKNMGKASMSFLTSLSLSFNNLRTKKGRTLLTAFAGSIGIIGIALILSLSTGVNNYIADIQKETMTSYPITISEETFDMSGLMELSGTPMTMGGASSGDKKNGENPNGVYADNSHLEAEQVITSGFTENDLTAFKKYLDDDSSEIHKYLGENGVVYTYDVSFDVFTNDKDGKRLNTDSDPEEATVSDGSGFSSMMTGMNNISANRMIMTSMLTGTSSSGAKNFGELMSGTNGNAVSKVITDSYDMLYGEWPRNYDEVVIILDDDNAIKTDALYQLGLLTAEEYQKIASEIKDGKSPEEIRWDYSEICEKKFYLLPACDNYKKNDDGTFTYIGENSIYADELADKCIELKVVGVAKLGDDVTPTSVMPPVGYTSALTNYIIDYTNNSEIVKAQESDPKVNVMNNMEFEAPNDEAKIADAKEYVSTLSISDKASLYTMIMYYAMGGAEAIDQAASTAESDSAIGADSANGANGAIGAGAVGGMLSSAGNLMSMGMSMDETTMAAGLDKWLENDPDTEILISLYDQYLSGGSYEDNMTAFGKVSYDAPYSISIYTDSFENKDKIAECISDYNKTVDEDSQITYTDYVALLTSSITSIVDAISYVLIAFVAVSLIVSCIMIGIITHISVLERTKEIGILRALGASKRNISQVFNAETIIIGLCAGLLGVGITELFTIPINAIIASLLGSNDLTATLPILSALILVAISVLITVIGGLIPARKAAKKDPVTALRTE